MHSLLLLPLFLSSVAEAGKLEAGWRGIPYGDPSVLKFAPGKSCVASPEPGVKWSCTEKVGTASVVVHYVVMEDLYAGVLIRCKGYRACRVLFETVTIAWEAPFTKEYEGDTSLLPDGFFNLHQGHRDGVVASWTYNRFSDEGEMITADMRVNEEQKRRRAAQAASAAESI